MLTFTDRFSAIKAAAIDQIKLCLLKCENLEYKLEGDYMEYNYHTHDLYKLRHVREERGRVYVLGEFYWEDGEYDFQVEELSEHNVGFIVDEMIKI